MKQLPIVVLKECPCVGTKPYSLHVPSYFGGRSWIWCEHSHTFPQDVQSTIALVVTGLEMEGILVSVVD